ncbi:potassium channel family protein [Pseudalkalibacillus caeni]|uniref:Two pore domain potassium channel family protein n=1 Tax=Exobacillus caeni TaxID=2574798 RepID=A0A5R9EZX3_9BACL|nr:potassium channel family protein [Pseudalkalibacillus caeni]TLS35690.1 two pore domain potassium channel family protein [Pseudalkalibacillus caeni]
MLWLFILTIGLTVMSVWGSFVSLLKRTRVPGSLISVYKLIMLFLVYMTLITAFGSLYLVFLMVDVPVLQQGSKALMGSAIEQIESVLYFSAVTLLSVGYGDITPVGVGRWIAIIEALIGYLMPAAFFVTTIIEYKKHPSEL